ncbi:hypothetical protein [Foetidibacter luteolus]|uniref:hypothetical protein n=1 Tax=Foetidibacter luteolus TaxID=2608880 RepID=UPI00129B2C78|nr:hypothetical protein [Foetidibacter luteolus]
MRLFLSLTLIVAISCNTGEPDNSYSMLKDTLKHPLLDTLQHREKIIHKPLTDYKELYGFWESRNKEPLTIEINADSIYYVEHFESHRYSLKGDSIVIDYPGFIYTGKVYFENDALIIESEDGKSKYNRLKN